MSVLLELIPRFDDCEGIALRLSAMETEWPILIEANVVATPRPVLLVVELVVVGVGNQNSARAPARI